MEPFDELPRDQTRPENQTTSHRGLPAVAGQLASLSPTDPEHALPLPQSDQSCSPPWRHHQLHHAACPDGRRWSGAPDPNQAALYAGKGPQGPA